jgi:hypothetical protein
MIALCPEEMFCVLENRNAIDEDIIKIYCNMTSIYINTEEEICIYTMESKGF